MPGFEITSVFVLVVAAGIIFALFELWTTDTPRKKAPVRRRAPEPISPWEKGICPAWPADNSDFLNPMWKTLSNNHWKPNICARTPEQENARALILLYAAIGSGCEHLGQVLSTHSPETFAAMSAGLYQIGLDDLAEPVQQARLIFAYNSDNEQLENDCLDTMRTKRLSKRTDFPTEYYLTNLFSRLDAEARLNAALNLYLAKHGDWHSAPANKAIVLADLMKRIRPVPFVDTPALEYAKRGKPHELFEDALQVIRRHETFLLHSELHPAELNILRLDQLVYISEADADEMGGLLCEFHSDALDNVMLTNTCRTLENSGAGDIASILRRIAQSQVSRMAGHPYRDSAEPIDALFESFQQMNAGKRIRNLATAYADQHYPWQN